jgi:carboxymethylenebutenolidase
VRSAAAFLRSPDGGSVGSLFTVGFCFGGRHSFLCASIEGLDPAGVIGFYGPPVGAARNDSPPPAEMASRFTAPVLGLFGGADQAIPPEAIETFDRALTEAGIEHRLESYPDAPHSFFDRRADEYAKTSERAWADVLEFVRAHTAGVATPA